MEKNIQIKVDKWLNENYDDDTKNEIRNLTINNEKELIDSFYKELEFGTGGLRGIMGAGTNRMNKYTVGAAAQGLSNYIIKFFGEKEKIKVAVAYDSRNNSRFFAETVSNIFSANGFEVFLFDALRPTPELSFAVRYLNCKAGVVITASHNPKEYNGFKAYWNDGGQIVPPHDKNIIVEVNKISEIEQIKFEAIKAHIYIIGEEIDNIYLKKIKELSISPEIIEKNSDLKIVYTAIHGSGVNLVPKVLKNFGFKNVYTVKEQDISDGNFPTVNSPNPENADALEMAVNLAKEIDADLVLATDPDADRVGIAVKDNNEKFILLNGNQTASVLIYYLIKKKFENNLLKGNEYIVKTIVTSELLVEIAKKYKVEYFDVLTGFKYIAEIIKENEGKKLFIGGGEESYGYLAGEFVRDKDAVMASALIAETAAWAKENGKSFYEQLIEIYVEFGFFKETLVNIVKKGKEGAEEIKKMMSDYRKNHLVEIAGMKVVEIKDYLIQESVNMINGTKSPINLPKADVIQFFIEDGTKVTVRPSGTEPKIKFYIGLKETLNSKEDFEEINKIADEKLNNIKKSLNLL